MYKNLLLFITLIVLGQNNLAQDAVFSQYTATPLQVNPSFAGMTYAPRIILNYRNQWSAFNNAYTTYAASYDQYFDKVNSGIGFSVLSDNAGSGIYKTNVLHGTYAYKFRFLQNLYLKGGVELGVGQVNLDWDRLIFLDQIDPLLGFNEDIISQENRPDNSSKTFLDVGLGAMAYNKNFYAGVSVKHVNTPDESILNPIPNITNDKEGLVPMRVTFHAGTEINFKRNNKKEISSFISPNLLVVKQGNFSQINGGVYAAYQWIFGGLWFRHSGSNSDAVIALIGLQKDVFKIGYSYDATVSSLNNYVNGTHEVSLILNFDNAESIKRRRFAKRYDDCFKMFR